MDLPSTQENLLNKSVTFSVQSPSGMIQTEWDNKTPFSSNGQLVYFAEYLAASNLFEDFCDKCPLEFRSNNAPKKRDVLGTILVSILSGHNRYSHISQVFHDQIGVEVLDLEKMCSEDSIRRALDKIDEAEGSQWLDEAYMDCLKFLYTVPWILDIDSTVKPVYGNQEGAEIGYNPKRPGRPSYNIHSYFIANLRLLINAEVRPGTESAGSHGLPGLFAYLDSIPRHLHPQFIRGDISYGSEATMRQAEKRQLNYLFKIKRSPKIKSLIKTLMTSENVEWENAGQGWQGYSTSIQLQGWTEERRIIIQRKKVTKTKESKNITESANQNTHQPKAKQLEFDFNCEVINQDDKNEYTFSILVTNLTDTVLTVCQHYRDRGDCENNYDELKNQWGWGGFTSKNFTRSQMMTRIVGIIYNWWNIYVRLAIPEKHAEAITSRKMFLEATGRLVKHAGQRTIKLCSAFNINDKIAKITLSVSRFLAEVRSTAPQLGKESRWKLILAHAFRYFLRGRPLAEIDDGKQGLLAIT